MLSVGKTAFHNSEKHARNSAFYINQTTESSEPKKTDRYFPLSAVQPLFFFSFFAVSIICFPS